MLALWRRVRWRQHLPQVPKPTQQAALAGFERSEKLRILSQRAALVRRSLLESPQPLHQESAAPRGELLPRPEKAASLLALLGSHLSKGAGTTAEALLPLGRKLSEAPETFEDASPLFGRAAVELFKAPAKALLSARRQSAEELIVSERAPLLLGRQGGHAQEEGAHAAVLPENSVAAGARSFHCPRPSRGRPL